MEKVLDSPPLRVDPDGYARPHPVVVQALSTLLSEMQRLLRPMGGSQKIVEAIAALDALKGAGPNT